jgi:hypothetical protein
VQSITNMAKLRTSEIQIDKFKANCFKSQVSVNQRSLDVPQLPQKTWIANAKRENICQGTTPAWSGQTNAPILHQKGS